jgi:hypothetical protein
LYLQARRSMVFAKHLRDIGDDFRREFLDSTDEEDGTVLQDWTEMEVSDILYSTTPGCDIIVFIVVIFFKYRLL